MERLYTPGLDRREASLPQLRRAVSLDDHVRDRNIELVAQSVDDARLEPVRLAARVGGDDHLVGAMPAELVLDRAKRRVRVSDLAGHGEAVGTCPGERRGETVAGFVELPVDVGAQLRAMKGAVRYHGGGASEAASRSGRRRSGSLVATAQANPPTRAPASSATPTSGSTSEPSASAAPMSTAHPTAMWNASASLRTGSRILVRLSLWTYYSAPRGLSIHEADGQRGARLRTHQPPGSEPSR